MNPFKGISKKVQEIELPVDGKKEKLKVKPTVKDAELFMMMKGQNSDEDSKRMIEILKNIIKNANDDLDEEDVDAIIANHFGVLIKEISILFGFATREQLEKVLDKETKKKGES